MQRIHYLLFIGLLIIGGCAVNPVTGEKQLSFASTSQQIAMGSNNYGPYQQMQGGRYVVDPDLNVYVNSVGKKVAQFSPINLPYEFVVLNNDTPNAWALPGGKIAINRGLLALLDNEAQLAAVLGHEVVHAAAGHSANQMAKAQLANVGVLAAGIAGQNTEYGSLITAGAAIGSKAVMAKYGRDQELESDYYGMEYMAKAGYDPQGAVELQQKFVELSKNRNSDFLSQLFASHPPSNERVERNRQRVASLNIPGANKLNKQNYQQAIRTVLKDKAAYDLHQQALAAAQKQDYDKALNLTQEAINKQPKEALFHLTSGKIHLQQKRYSQASSAFTKATQTNPEYFQGYLGLGLSELEQKNYSNAQRNLERSHALLETPTSSFYLGELAYRSGDTSKAISYYRNAAQDSGTVGKKANERLQQLQTQSAP